MTTPWTAGEVRTFTRDAGDYQVVNATGAEGISGSAYLSSGTVGARALFSLAALSGSGVVTAVQVSNLVGKSDAGTAASKNLLRSGGVEVEGPTTALSTTPLYAVSVHELAPDGSAWTVSAVNALEAGLKIAG